eukprot:364350-Chlamydomonas_euryale.AAC.7
MSAGPGLRHGSPGASNQTATRCANRGAQGAYTRRAVRRPPGTLFSAGASDPPSLVMLACRHCVTC